MKYLAPISNISFDESGSICTAKNLVDKIFGTNLPFWLKLHWFPPEFAPYSQHLHFLSKVKYTLSCQVFQLSSLFSICEMWPGSRSSLHRLLVLQRWEGGGWPESLKLGHSHPEPDPKKPALRYNGSPCPPWCTQRSLLGGDWRACGSL